MSSTTTHLGLTVPTTSDGFSTAGLAGNWNILDQFPGSFVGTAAQCTSEVASWGANQNGILVSETDTGLVYRWNGSVLVRLGPTGFLGESQSTSNVTFATTAENSILSLAITVPAGGRWVEAHVTVPAYTNTAAAYLWIVDGSTQIEQYDIPAVTNGSFSHTTLWTPSSGAHTIHFYMGNVTGTTTGTLTASATSPIKLWVKEI